MGGSAFAERLSAEAFPRLPPVVYYALKAHLMLLLQQEYLYVGVPREDPQKPDHGDLDFIVTQPRDTDTTCVPNESIKALFGAFDVISGNPTTNYAVPVEDGEWEQYGLLELENSFRAKCADRKIYYQVSSTYMSVKVMKSGRLLARKNGLSFGLLGLKVEVAKRENYLRLSLSFEHILQFFGLSIDTYNAGFNCKDDIFRWLTTSKYFDPSLFQSDILAPRRPKREGGRLDAFIEFVARLQPNSTPTTMEGLEARKKRVVDEALTFFDKHQAYRDKWREYEEQQEARRRADEERAKVRKIWSGSRVNDWAEMNGYWSGVKKIMDVVRLQLGGDDAIVAIVNEQGEESVRTLVIQVRDQLGIVPRKPEELPPTTTPPA
ncbi:hypothetical protein CVT24_002321 [Panaeolus cyanescens]|uniref:Uncharacterized protein n=1 Tax=Panaeolus cyanescens TaxID=181874 RepID=A0A409YII4_9AGAR|nr:hypothetical protein CVT24_002321 [Panaeolus cyanescens]